MGRKKKSQLEEKIIKHVNPDAIKVSVTKDDIKNGKPRNEECCPIALALCRAFDYMLPGAIAVQSSFVSLSVTGEESDRSTQLPKEAIDFISSFDAGDEVLPIEFEIDSKPLKKSGTKLLPENSLDKIQKLPIDKNETSDKLLDIEQVRSD